MNYKFSEMIHKIKERNYIKWLFWTMVLGYIINMVSGLLWLSYEGPHGDKVFAFCFKQLVNISGIMAYFAHALLILLYPIAKITKKFKFPLPGVYFLIPLALLLIGICAFISMNDP